MKEKKVLTTLQVYKRWQRGNMAMQVAKYVTPCVPATIITSINYQEWFVNCGPSLPLGFVTLLLSVVLSILGISKQDNFVKDKLSGLIYVALTFACFGIAFKFLSSIMNQMGDMFLWTALAICGSFAEDQTVNMLFKPNIDMYKELVKENGLDPKETAKSKRKEKIKEKALKEAREIAEMRRRAVE